MDDQTMFDLFDSLKPEIKPLKDGLDRIEARLARQGGIIQGGTRQIGRLRGKPGGGGDPRKTTP